MSAAVQWSDVATVIGILAVMFGGLWFLWSRIAQAEDRAVVSVTAVKSDLADFRLKVAEQYVSRDNLKDLEDRLVQAIERLGDRLDRVLENKPR